MSAYIHHSDCLLHKMGDKHPEKPARLVAIEEHIKAAKLMELLDRHEAPLATAQQLARVHDSKYIDKIINFQDNFTLLTADTVLTNQTPQAALRAAGALVHATDLVLTDQHKTAFCNVRPPGHHALPDQAMGFCFFNNVAVGAAHAIAEYGLERVAILDFDVHHGNGTEAIFQSNPKVMLCSTFQHPFYPGSGADTVSDHIINVPLAANTGGEEFREAITEHWLPNLHKFKPQLIFISAGFDAHKADRISRLNLLESDYIWVTEEILKLANKYAEGRVISALEGGYELRSLADSVVAHLKILLN
ncbi:MAG: histone deacetylase family protein [Candidatus Marithrix sp.]